MNNLDVFTQLGLTTSSAQQMENSLVQLLIHVIYNNGSTLPLYKVYKSLEKPLGPLVSIWKNNGISKSWEIKMDDIRKKRNWLTHSFLEERTSQILNGDFDSLVRELQDLQNEFHSINLDLQTEIENHVQKICLKKGISRSSLHIQVNKILTIQMLNSKKSIK